MEMFNKRCSRCIYENTCIENPNDCHSYIDKDGMVYAFIPDGNSEFDNNNTIELGVAVEEKSHLKVGNLIIHNTHRFNWFERKMWKLLLGFDIENVEE